MQDVLFQTANPTTASGKIEFYDLLLTHEEKGEGQAVSVVRELHGWWQNSSNGAVIDEEASREPRRFVTYYDALSWYCQRRLFHMNRNFTHSFLWHPISGIPSFYKRLEMEIPANQSVVIPDPFAEGHHGDGEARVLAVTQS